MKLTTIQKREKLNNVYTIDEPGNGGANHAYEIKSISENEENLLTVIQFQDGARKEENSIAGVIDSDLVEIVKHRLESFQKGPFRSRENTIVLTHLENALMWMNRRVEDRIERNVLGQNKK